MTSSQKTFKLQDRTDIDVPYIPNFGSLESVNFGQTSTDDPEAQALLKGFEKSSEQLLWKQWARRPSGSLRATSPHTSSSDLSSSGSDIFSSCRSQSMTELSVGSAAVSPFNKKKSGSRGILKPPSPLDATVVSQDIRSWLEKASADQGYSKPRVDESRFSLSSEEGIYSLSALDSDEEEAYSYILDLNKEVCQPYNQPKRQVPRVEEETAEEMFLNGQQTDESKHLEVFEMLNSNGCKHHDGSLAQHVESDGGAQSAVHMKSDWDEDEISSREMANTGAVFDSEPEGQEEERVVSGQSNDEGDYSEEERKTEKTESAKLVTHGFDETEARVDESEETKLFEVASWGEETERGLFEKCGQAREKRVTGGEEEEANLTMFGEGQERKFGKERDEEDNVAEEEMESVSVAVHEVRGAGATRTNTGGEDESKVSDNKMEDFNCTGEDEEEYDDEVMNSVDVEAAEKKDGDVEMKRRELTDKEATTSDRPGETTSRNESTGGVNVHGGDASFTPGCSATSQSFR